MMIKVGPFHWVERDAVLAIRDHGVRDTMIIYGNAGGIREMEVPEEPKVVAYLLGAMGGSL